MKKYYVYLYMREDLYSPYYVGSGNGRRCYTKYIRKDRIPPKDRNLIRVVYEGEEKECRELESILILFYGLKSEGGILENKRIDSCGIPLIEEYHRRRMLENKKRYWEENREELNEKQKEKYRRRVEREGKYWEKGDKEEYNRKQRERVKSEEYREKKRERNRKYYEKNKERFREEKREYYQKKRDGL